MKPIALACCSLMLLLAYLIDPLLPKATQLSFDPYQQEIPGTEQYFGMVPIPAGEFIMGSAESEKGRLEDEGPQRKVSLDAFWIGTHEITWDLFEMFLDKNYEASVSEKALPVEVDGLTRPSTPYLDMTFGMGKGNRPAIAMTQYGAIQFCKWLYVKTGIFYRLPTEAEWEYAARAGSEDTYFFGNDPDQINEYAWHAGNSGESTHPVGLKKPNPWGLYDILGNVMEWTYDGYQSPYPKAQDGIALKNPIIEPSSLYPRVLRGGHYESGAEDLRSAKRFFSTPVWKQLDPQIPKSKWWFPEAPFLGLRVVRPYLTPSEEVIMAYYDQSHIDDY
ncbi:formylglycine-generating enzyme family protein [Pararhodonellum marinum]|uniref:formylglycine-generating enzyme family protein n=1 Tax=Pararhodonellum marinum TaxID=2755358 RepID=UPI001E6274D9|nr:SUMF1/EgtB/PvdO family nonheme iron enzyme [Pararhodonellum marinum]